MHYCLACILKVICFDSMTVGNFCISIACTCSLTKKIILKRNKACVARDILAVAHFILFQAKIFN